MRLRTLLFLMVMMNVGVALAGTGSGWPPHKAVQPDGARPGGPIYISPASHNGGSSSGGNPSAVVRPDASPAPNQHIGK